MSQRRRRLLQRVACSAALLLCVCVSLGVRGPPAPNRRPPAPAPTRSIVVLAPMLRVRPYACPGAWTLTGDSYEDDADVQSTPPSLKVEFPLGGRHRGNSNVLSYEEYIPPDVIENPLELSSNWTTVGSYYILSAYDDRRLHPQRFIRIIGMVRGSQRPPLYCQVDYGEKGILVVDAVSTDIWPENWDPGGLFTPVLISCPLPKAANAATPETVSLSLKACSGGSARLRVQGSRERRGTFAVCVKALRLRRPWGARLVEWLELLRMLGAARVFAYVRQLPAADARLLRRYQRRGTVTLLPHSPPPADAPPRLWDKRRAEVAAYNDCLYRNINAYDYVIPLDIDEVPVPVEADDWQEALSALPAATVQGAASLAVRNAYFFGSFRSPRTRGVSPLLHAMQHTVRSARLSPGRDAAKSFVSTRRALTTLHHWALHPLSGAAPSALLPPSVLRLHHYRHTCDSHLIDDCSRFLARVVSDTTALKYAARLQGAVLPVLQELGLE